MKFSQILLTASVAGFMWGSALSNADAQDRGDRGGRGGDRGDRGDRGSRGFGGDSGGGGFGRGGGSSFGGGPPGGFGGGGFGGGPPGGFGGGPPGGFGGGGFGGPPGGFGGGTPGGGRSMMDTNGNGVIDQDEIDRMPSFVRDMMQSRGVVLKAGMTVDQMRSGFSRSPDSSSGGPPRGSENGNNPPGSSGTSTAVLKPYKMKPKPSLIQTLPPAYSEIDVDFDGQLGLDEWMLARRTELNQFDEMDTDHDGFLIPEELKAAEVAANGSNAAMAVRTAKLTIVSATSKSQASSRSGEISNDGRSSRWSAGGSSTDVAEQAKQYFPRLDQNQDGVIDTDEFQQSRRVRGMFEQAGISPGKMSLEQFTQNLQKATAATQSSGGR